LGVQIPIKSGFAYMGTNPSLSYDIETLKKSLNYCYVENQSKVFEEHQNRILTPDGR